MEEKAGRNDGDALRVAEDIISTPKTSETPKIPEPEAKPKPEEKENPTNKVAQEINNEIAATRQKIHFTTGGRGELESTSPTEAATPKSEQLAKQAHDIINIKLNSGNPSLHNRMKARHNRMKARALEIAHPSKYGKKTSQNKTSRPTNILAREKLLRQERG